MMKTKLEILCFLIFIFFHFATATLSKSDRKKSKSEKKIAKMDSQSESDVSYKIHNALNVSVNYQDILDEHRSFSMTRAMIRHVHQDVVGYVTPWNSRGYDIAKLYSAKFTMMSPVWLQIKPKNEKGGFMFGGLHDIDINWLFTLKHINKKMKIVPRVIFEQWTYPTITKLLENKAEDVSMELISLAKDNAFDGYIIEIWSLLRGQMKVELTDFIKKIAAEFKQQNLVLILVIPPPAYSKNQKGMFVREDFENLVDHVTAFSLMTYDFSGPQKAGPNSPIPWLIQCVEDLIPNKSSPNKKKILLGLNFYGNIYSKSGGKPIIGREYISLLEKYKPKIVFKNISGEHVFRYRDENIDYVVYYPTLYSIELRVQLAKKFGIGIAIWELGQGLDYFYDLL